MKKLGALLILLTFISAACGNNDNKYQEKIEKVQEIQAETHKVMKKKEDSLVDEFDKRKANYYVFKDGKIVVVGYKLFKESDQLFLAAYEFEDGKVYYKRDINPQKYIKEHKANYKEENIK
ncbi:cystatin-like fold lipoprotein [Mammaliicoccus sp. Dog046]|uniref:cystatin-like fold lipoprotein n=1 Tax=Mammaliicoccus sp. Dog046 TaxID=3034233 RepID=UPI002B25C439|nr:cystatin-like fold lipoprotein [Mammaliicoccus sp. Dog046]WQK85599.1 cystatin-like fold lipoprotein [Mammaliicoccus sp. Dog046]